ncbi:hypothetical protein [Marinitenerispora sediminis]|uniref:DUF3995 domain-containing protein n=1 Tax=Marinitenerispora sediminis TaxID=1931232 RepID=A0A368T4H0_9ACTN|nr:hypothetical protein [Marinitenerispora sediminis]RCV56021.1 hypothetical protein DEF28_04460 [Marinitenerispora sediminis]RCV57744.1 hypothetical protein DEF24_14680 [Marinitenerispora sediminis]RCV60991.1 hypothetical protein DEF23_03610 [Marinitenerispora sediminis]
MNTLTGAPPAPGRLRAAWRAAHAPVAGVPRWARIAAYAIPFAVLPSGLWRIAAVVLHTPLTDGPQGTGDLPSWLPIEVYVVLLSVGSELLAFTAIGLVAAWGEVVPRWVPVLRGRRVPVAAAVVPALLGAAALTTLWTSMAVLSAVGRTLQGDPLPAGMPLAAFDWQAAVFAATYAPLLLWGPLLGAVALAYWRRRTGGGPAPAVAAA